MRKRPSIRVLVGLTVALSGCGIRPVDYVARGNRFLEGEKYQDAALNYRKATQKDPNYGEAYYQLGLASIRMNQGRQAYEALVRAVQLMPANTGAKERLADVCLSFYLADESHPHALYNTITSLADLLLAENKKSYEGWMLKGYLASTDRKPREAVAFFRKALQADSSNAGVATQTVKMMIADGQKREAEQMAAEWIDRRKTTYGAIYDLMYAYYSESGQNLEAQRVLEKKVSNNPARADYILQLAGHYYETRDNAGMVAALGRLLGDAKNFPDARLWVGNFYLARRNYAEALRYYQEGAAANPAEAAYQRGIVVALVGLGKKDEAMRRAEQVLTTNPTDTQALRLHASLLLENGQRENAARAAREFQQLALKDPNDVSLLVELGRAYRLSGDLAAARTQFLGALRKQDDLLVARYELAELSLLENQPRETIRHTSEILKLSPKDRRARLLRTRALIGLGEGEDTRTELLDLAKEMPGDSEPQVQLGYLALAERNYREAVRVLDKQRERGGVPAFVGLAKAYLHQKQFDAARQTLDEALKQWPESGALIEQLADTEAVSGHYDRAAGYYQKLLTLDPKSLELNRRLAEVSELVGDHASALHYAQQAHDLAPGDPAGTLGLAAALARVGRTDEAKAQYESAVKLSPENAPVLNNAAYFLADSGGDLDEALRLARRAIEKIPSQPDFSDTVGYIYLKKGWRDSAIQTFRNLERQYPSYAGCRYHLGLALYEKGDRRAARQELESALGRNPSADDRLRIEELLKKIG